MHQKTWWNQVRFKLILILSLIPIIAIILSGWIPGSEPTFPFIVQALSGDPVLVGAGDIANCDRIEDDETAKLLDGISGTVFTLGDNAYPDGAQAQFDECYEPTWGRHKDRTRPSPGNHDYHITGASGYFGYFGSVASPLDANCTQNCKGYYSYNLGDWHIVVLNSEMAHEAGSAQEQWLRADLAANQTTCTLAYWHKPRFSSGKHGNNPEMDAFWQALYEFGADVVLNGHDHTYERFGLQDPSGYADPNRGIRQFVVGTGGAGLYDFPSIQPNSQVRDNKTWGVLKLTLHAETYDWRFIPLAGANFTDAGSARCVNPGPRAEGGQNSDVPQSPAETPTKTDLIFKDDFDTGELANWSEVKDDSGDLIINSKAALEGKQGLQVFINDDNSVYLEDHLAESESHYQLQFSFDPNSIRMGDGDSHNIFFGYFTGTKAVPVVRISFRLNKGNYQLNAAARDNNEDWLKTEWVTIRNEPHTIDLAWHAATTAENANGRLTLWVDGSQRDSLIGIENNSWRIDRIRLGAVSGIDSSTRGNYYFDDFESLRRISDYPRNKRPGKSTLSEISSVYSIEWS